MDDKNYTTSVSDNANLKISKITTKLDFSHMADAKINKTIRLILKLYHDSNIAGEKIIFKINDEIISTGITNHERIAIFEYLILNEGSYKFTIEYEGNEIFESYTKFRRDIIIIIRSKNKF